MDPISASEVLIKVYQAAGLLGLMMLGFAVLIYAGYKDNKAREKSMVGTIAKCHETNATLAEEATTALVRSSVAIENNNRTTEDNTRMLSKICDIVDVEFKRRGDTPADGNPVQHHHR